MRKYLKNFSKVISCLLICLMVFTAGVGCNNNENSTESGEQISQVEELKGFMWEVSKDNQKGYLVGTIHSYAKDYDYENDVIKKILKESDGLAVELDIADTSIVTDSLGYLMAGEGETIEVNLDDEDLNKFKNFCTDNGIIYDNIKEFSALGIGTKIENKFSANAGLTEKGYDEYLLEKFKDKKKEIVSLETVELQMNLLKQVYTYDYIKQIPDIYTEDYIKEQKEASKDLFDAFYKGDVSYIEKIAKDTKDQDENYYNNLLKARNINMVKKAEDLFASGKTYTIAVGSLHYAGEDGIVSLLEKDGYTVNRLE